jgi:hypothetical protein
MSKRKAGAFIQRCSNRAGWEADRNGFIRKDLTLLLQAPEEVEIPFSSK